MNTTPDKGNYNLIINVKKDSLIKIGTHGEINFKKGYYVYVGSALGSLFKRIKRHLSSDKKLHWHVDYLTLDENVKIEDVIYTYTTQKIECDISYNINEVAHEYIKGFGCSDCKCISHLYYFKTYDEAIKSSMNSYEKLRYKSFKWSEKKITDTTTSTLK